MRAVVLQHEEHEGPALLGEALQAAGFQLARRYRQVKREDLGAELVVVLGGGMAVYEQDRHPFLGAEVAFLAERLALGRPVLGICLGAQLMAAALGAEVFRGKNGFEVGVGPVRWTEAAQKDPVLAAPARPSTVAHWHGDTFERIPGATLLASTDRYTQQAFRVGPSFGFQFHPELSAGDFEHWVNHGEDALRAQGVDLAGLRAGIKKLRDAEPENRRLLERLAHHFKH